VNIKKLAASIAMVGLALGAGVSSAPAATAATPVTITIWTFGDVIEPNLVRQYKLIHPEVTLQLKKGDIDPQQNNMITACNSRSGPADVIAVEVSYSGWWRSYPNCFTDLRTMKTSSANANATKGVDKDGKTVDVTYVDSVGVRQPVGTVPSGQSATTIKSNYLPWRWEHGVAYNDSVIGIPTDVGGLEVAYRSDLMVKAGLVTAAQVKNGTARDVLAKKWPTWDKFIATGAAYMKKLSAADKKAGKGFLDSVGTIYAAILNQGTEKYYRNNGTDQGTLIYDKNPEIKKAWDTTLKAQSAGIGTRIGQFSSDWNVGMNKGTFATMLAPAWMMDYIKQQAPDTAGKWDIADLPGGGGNQGGTQLTIPSYSDDKQAAWDFIAWYLAPEQQLQVFRTYGLFPSTKVIYNDPSVKDFKDPFFNKAPVGKIYSEGILKLKPIFEGKLNRGIDQAFGAGLGRVISGKKNEKTKKPWTSKDSWAMVMTEVKKLVTN